MTHHPDIDALTAISQRDPNEGERQPTQADHDAHKQWAINTYGADVWRTYVEEPWGNFGTNPV